MKTDEYDDVDDLQADIELLTNNAKSFYKVNPKMYFCVGICSLIKWKIISSEI